MKIIDGKALAEQVKDGIAAEIYQSGEHPSLAIILVGNRPDSELYVKIKEREAKKVGIDTSLYRLEENTSEDEIATTINFLNNDPSIDGILLQLPLPEGLDTDKLVQSINPDKDIDGFVEENTKHLGDENLNYCINPTFLSILMCLESSGLDLESEKAAIVAKPGVFGQELAKLLASKNIASEILSPNDNNLAAKTNQAKILISAVGQAGLIRAEHIQPGALVIDVGISQNKAGETVGDVEASEAKDAGWLTPVPGGIGPLTVAFALKNTLECHNRRQ